MRLVTRPADSTAARNCVYRRRCLSCIPPFTPLFPPFLLYPLAPSLLPSSAPILDITTTTHSLSLYRFLRFSPSLDIAFLHPLRLCISFFVRYTPLRTLLPHCLTPHPLPLSLISFKLTFPSPIFTLLSSPQLFLIPSSSPPHSALPASMSFLLSRLPASIHPALPLLPSLPFPSLLPPSLPASQCHFSSPFSCFSYNVFLQSAAYHGHKIDSQDFWGNIFLQRHFLMRVSTVNLKLV